MALANTLLEKCTKLRTAWLSWSDQPRGRLFTGIIIACLGLGATAFYAHHLNGYYAIGTWLFWPVALLWIYNLVLFSSFWSMGHLVVVRLLKLDTLPTMETAVLSVSSGVVVFGMAMYLLGFTGLFNLTAAIVLPIVFVAPSIRHLLRFYRQRASQWKGPVMLGGVEGVVAFLATGFGAICLLFVYLPLLTPDSINFDAQWCHLTISQDYANAGRIIPFDADHARNIIQFAPLIHTWGWLLPMPGLTQRWTMPLHTEFIFLLWTLAGIAAAARYLLNNERLPRLWVVFFLFPAIYVYDMNLGGAADHVAAFFTPPLLLVTLRTMKKMEWRYLVLCGGLGGALLLTKYQGGYLLAACFLILLTAWLVHWRRWLRNRSDAALLQPRTLLIGAGLGLAAFVVVIAPHFGRNWVFHGNPLYPFAQDIFNSTPTVKDASFLVEYIHKDWNFRPHGTLFETVVEAFELFGTFAFKTHYLLTKDWPTYGGLFTLTLPMLLLLRRSRRIWLAAIVSWGALMMWAMTFRVDRNLQIFSPVIITTTAAMLVRVWQTGWVARAGLIPLVALQLVWGGDLVFCGRKHNIIQAIDIIASGYENNLQRRDNARDQYKRLNEDLPPTAKVIRHQCRKNLGILRDMPMDWPGAQCKYSYDELNTLQAFRDYLKKNGITHFIHIPNKRPAWNMHDEILFEDFIRNFPRKRYANLELVTITDKPLPNHQVPYKVAAIGVTGYGDGIYDLAQMIVQERLPTHLRKYPKPKNRLNRKKEDALNNAFEQVRAVLYNPRLLTPSVESTLSKEFQRVRKYDNKNLAVYIRRH